MFEGDDTRRHLRHDVGELSVRCEGQVPRTGSRRNLDERRIVRCETADLIGENLIQPEVGDEDRFAVGRKHRRVPVRTGLAAAIHT